MMRYAWIATLIVSCCGSAAAAAPSADQIGSLDIPSVMDEVVKLGDAAIPELTNALKGARPDLAAKALGRIKSRAALAPLLQLSSTKDDELRATIAWAIGQCHGSEALPALIALSKDPYAPVRISAIHGLTGGHTAESDVAIKSCLSDSLDAVRTAAVQAIEHANRPDLCLFVVPMLTYKVEAHQIKTGDDANATFKMKDVVIWKEPCAQIRLAAIRALGSAKVTESIPALIEALEREDSYNRQAIVAAVSGMGEGAASVCLGRIVPIPYDKDAFENHMPVLISNGTLAVVAGQLGDSRCVSALLNTLKLPRNEIGKDKDLTELYIQTVQMLGKFKCERAGRPLAELLKKTTVRQLSEAIQQAIRLIGRPAAHALADNMDDWSLAPVFLKLLREPDLRTSRAEGGILKFLTHESDEVRLEAVETLGQYIFEGILDEYDSPVLESMYLDPNSEVRAASRRWKDKIAQKLDARAANDK